VLGVKQRWPSCSGYFGRKVSEAPNMHAPLLLKQRKLLLTHILQETSRHLSSHGREGKKTRLGNSLYFHLSALTYKEIT